MTAARTRDFRDEDEPMVALLSLPRGPAGGEAPDSAAAAEPYGIVIRLPVPTRTEPERPARVVRRRLGEIFS